MITTSAVHSNGFSVKDVRPTTVHNAAPLPSKPAEIFGQIFSPLITHSSPSRIIVVLQPLGVNQFAAPPTSYCDT